LPFCRSSADASLASSEPISSSASGSFTSASTSSSSSSKAESMRTGAATTLRGGMLRSTARSIIACEPFRSSLGVMNPEMP